MSKCREEHFYFGFLVIIGLLEIALTIPLTVPLFDGTLSQIYLIVALIHVGGLLFLSTKMVDIRPYSLHIFGTMGFFFSVIPYINAVFHLAIFVLTFKACRKYLKYFKDIQGDSQTN